MCQNDPRSNRNLNYSYRTLAHIIRVVRTSPLATSQINVIIDLMTSLILNISPIAVDIYGGGGGKVARIF